LQTRIPLFPRKCQSLDVNRTSLRADIELELCSACPQVSPELSVQCGRTESESFVLAVRQEPFVSWLLAQSAQTDEQDKRLRVLRDKEKICSLFNGGVTNSVCMASHDWMIVFFNPTLFAICISTFSKLCKNKHNGM
jgi:hypothetical protein